MFKLFLKTIIGNSEYDRELLKAARCSDLTVETIDRLLHLGADINTVSLERGGLQGYTHLTHYISKAFLDLQVVEYLIGRGADPKLASKYGHTPLSSVPLERQTRDEPEWSFKDSRTVMSLTRLLVENGAQPNSRDSSGYTPLHSFVTCCSVDEVQLLLELGASSCINQCGKRVQGNCYWGFSPLHTAVFREGNHYGPRLPVIQLLIDWGADVNQASNSNVNFTPLGLARDRKARLKGSLKAWLEGSLKDSSIKSGDLEAKIDEVGAIEAFLISKGAS